MQRRIVLTAVILIPLLVMAIYLGRQSRPAPEPTTQPPTTIPVTRGDVQQTVIAPGHLVGTQEQVLNLESAGSVVLLAAQPGTLVAAGDTLLQLTDHTALTAPFAGVIVEVWVHQGEWITAGQPLMVLVDPAALEVVVSVIEEDLPLIAVGQTAELFFDALPDAVAQGQVTRIVPRRVPGENRPLYSVYLSLNNLPDGLVDGMTTDAVILIAQRQAVLRLPRAVVRAGEGNTTLVSVWTGSKIEARFVNIGLRGDVYVEIVSGLQEGQEVVGQ